MSERGRTELIAESEAVEIAKELLERHHQHPFTFFAARLHNSELPAAWLVSFTLEATIEHVHGNEPIRRSASRTTVVVDALTGKGYILRDK